MTLSKELRDQVCKTLKIRPRQLRNRIKAKCKTERVVDPDIGLLLVGFDEAEIDVTKPRFSVPAEKLEKFEEHLNTRKTEVVRSQAPLQSAKAKKGKKPDAHIPTLLNFKRKTPTYPHIFYDKLEDEINTAYGDQRLPNAALVLSRKLIENLVFNLLQYKFGPQGKIELYFDKDHARAKDFSVLIENLKNQKSEFDADIQSQIDKFLTLVPSFRTDANAKAHNVMEYLESIAQLRKFKVPEMTAILLELISRVRA